MRKITLIAALITLTGCAEQGRVEKWECASEERFYDFIIDYENKTVGYGNPIIGGFPIIKDLTVNGNVLRFDLQGGYTVTMGKTSATDANFYFREESAKMPLGICKRTESR